MIQKAIQRGIGMDRYEYGLTELQRQSLDEIADEKGRFKAEDLLKVWKDISGHSDREP